MIALIAAMAQNRVIGKDNKLPWHSAQELKNFKQITLGGIVIMGRKTFESIGRPLPNRKNMVVSSSMAAQEGVEVFHSLTDALREAKASNQNTFIIGGARMFSEALQIVDKMFISYMKGDFEGDVFFPTFDTSAWVVESSTMYPEFEFVVYRRK